MTKYASKIDAFVGDRIRRKRIACGFSADELARKLGVSAEDIEDFETGAARVGARRLLRLGEIFGVSTSYFFHADESAVADPEPVEAEDGLRLLRAFSQIRNPVLRDLVVRLAQVVAKVDGPGPGQH